MTKADVIRVQELLAHMDYYSGKIDGLAGPMTRAAIVRWQREHDLKDDGIAGPITLKAMFPLTSVPAPDIHPEFYLGAAKPLDPTDVASVAKSIGVDPKAFKAIVTVEAQGKPFDAKHRVIALYEPHIAYRMADPDVRRELVRAGLAYAKWGTRRYPKTMEERFAQIDKVSEIGTPELAADATSWGMGQIMGFNAQSAGYLNAVDMVKAFAADAENQVAAMGAFTLNNHALLRALIRLDWATVAELWNGAAYRKNHYDTKLASAYKEG